MDKQNCGSKKDKRLLVLLALGGGILGGAWFSPKPAPQSCDYYWSPSGGRNFPVVVCTAKKAPDATGVDFVRLSTDTPCADTPPQLAMFFNLPLPVNRADHNTLTMLPGIGPRLAENLILYRRGQGKISGPEALVQVDGIGKNLADRLLPMICFD